MPETYSFRDRVKVACLQACIQQGLNEEEMILLFKTAASNLRMQKDASDGPKPSSWVNAGKSALAAAKVLSLLGIATLPVAAVAGAAPAYVAGRTAANMSVGRLPSPEEIKLTDEIAAYDKVKDEVNQRIRSDEEEQKKRNKPSVRRMFCGRNIHLSFITYL